MIRPTECQGFTKAVHATMDEWRAKIDETLKAKFNIEDNLPVMVTIPRASRERGLPDEAIEILAKEYRKYWVVGVTKDNDCDGLDDHFLTFTAPAWVK